MQGVFEFQVGEVKRGFKFGTYAFAVACEREKCILSELLQKIGVGRANPDVNILTLLNIFYGAAVHYAKSNNQEITFNDSHVSDWIDEIGFDKVNSMLVEGFKQYTPKNSNSLQEKRETITA